MPDQQPTGKESHEVIKRTAPGGIVVYNSILEEGKRELERSSTALAWSGLAAGLSMGFSMIGEGLIAAYLPQAPWAPLIHSFGYSLGFLVVILGRQQLFTENTLTPILPLLQEKTVSTLFNVARLWSVVLIANLLGAAAIALYCVRTEAFDPHIREEFLHLGREAIGFPFGNILLRGIVAGWLIALVVWLLPFAETARVWIIIILTYFIALSGSSHVVAGSVEVFTLAAIHEISWFRALLGYTLPSLLGNIIGGVTLVALINHAQIFAGAAKKNARS